MDDGNVEKMGMYALEEGEENALGIGESQWGNNNLVGVLSAASTLEPPEEIFLKSTHPIYF